MSDKISALTGDNLIFSKISNDSKQIEQEEVNSIIDEVRGDSSTIDTEKLYNTLLKNYEIENEEELLDIINQAASYDGNCAAISNEELKQVYKVSSSTNVSNVNEASFDTQALYQMNAEQFCNSMNPEIKSQLINYLESEVNEIQAGLDDTKQHNGLISGLWDGIKNLTGIGASSNKAQNEIDKVKNALNAAKSNPVHLATAYKTITGKELTAEEFDKICTGESSLITDSKAAQSVTKYQDGQRMATDVLADTAVSFISVAAVAAAGVTGGASLVLGAAVGAAVKVGVKFIDAKSGGREYNLKDAGYDAVTGGVGGAMSIAGAKLGNVVSTGIGKVAKLPMLEKVIATRIGGAAFNYASRSVVRYSTGFAAGAADAVARDVMTGETDNILGDVLKQGNAAGLTSVVIGTAADTAHAGFNKIKGAKAAPAGNTGALADDIKGLPDKGLDADEVLKGEILDVDGKVIGETDFKVIDSEPIKTDFADDLANTKKPSNSTTKLLEAEPETKLIAEVKSEPATPAQTKSVPEVKPVAEIEVKTADIPEAKPVAEIEVKTADIPEVKPVSKSTQNTLGTKEASSINGKKISLTDKNGNAIECTTQIKTTATGERIEILNPQGEVIGYSNVQVMEANDFSNVYDGQAHLHVDLMENTAQSSVSGVGTELHKLNVIRSQELGLGGKVAFDSMQRAMGFHYTSGFRCAAGSRAQSAAACDALIESALNSSTERLVTVPGIKGSLTMYIPEENISKILA